MDSGDFFKRFADHQEIGRDITDSHLSVFYDNGSDVGMWRQERATTIGDGEVLARDDADAARTWCKKQRSSENDWADVPARAQANTDIERLSATLLGLGTPGEVERFRAELLAHNPALVQRLKEASKRKDETSGDKSAERAR